MFKIHCYATMMNLKEDELLTYFTWFHMTGTKVMEVLFTFSLKTINNWFVGQVFKLNISKKRICVGDLPNDIL